jgi:PPK2 family polyphosphate:nucleotide phosphotransferase
MNQIEISNPYEHRLQPGQAINLNHITTKGKELHPNRAEADAEFKQLRDELAEWQYNLYAADQQKLLIILQALDAGGKDGTIRRIFAGVNPQGVIITSFKVPSARELSHDFLWRIHQAVPGRGQIGVFNRSHYEDVLVVRVDEVVPTAVWQARYELINDFEKLLTQTGTHILKFYLHISKEEQRQRLQERLDDPTKNWKFELGDLHKRQQWDDYRAAYNDALTYCNTNHAPWYVIPSDQNWYRNLAIMRVIVHTLRQINPQTPPVTADLSGIVIE